MKTSTTGALLLLMVCLIHSTLTAQTWQWGTAAGGPANDQGNSLVLDPSGNSYVTGIFYDTAHFGGTDLVNPGTTSIFIAKYNPNGNLIWANIAASAPTLEVTSIALDSGYNLIITGRYTNTASFGYPASSTLASAGSYDVFVARYAPNGSLIWAQTSGGVGIDNVGGISVDAVNNVYITGEFHISAFPFSSSKIFIEKFDSTGNLNWLKTEPNFGLTHIANGIKTDPSGNSYITGSFFNTLQFDSVTVNAGNVESNVFILKFNTLGNVMWGQHAGAGTGYAGGNAIAVDTAGNTYITGFYRGSINFEGFNISGTAGLAYEVFIARCNQGGHFVWVNTSTGACSATGIAADNQGNAYICGIITGTTNFGTNTLTTTGGNDIFIVSTDISGSFTWATTCGGPDNDVVNDIQTNSAGTFITGNFINLMHLGPSITLSGNSNSQSDVFLAKLENTIGLEPEKLPATQYICYPNPATNNICIAGGNKNETYEIFDLNSCLLITGTIGSGNPINLSGLKNGIYIVKIKNPLTPGNYWQTRIIKI